MIKFLTERPIAVLMAFTAFFMLGLAAFFTLPVSLLPDIAIPEITVQVSEQNTSARELENTVMKPVREQLQQLMKLKEMKSEARDGAGIIHLSFEHGTDTDLAFIEVNEKIDAAMNFLPREVTRPKVVKVSAADLPVFYVNLTLKKGGEEDFPALCRLAENVVKRRIGQLPEVAMVDVTGLQEQQLQLRPDREKMVRLGITEEELENALKRNNVEPGSMTVRDGYSQYQIRFSTLLRTEEDIRAIVLNKDGRLFRLADFCQVSTAGAGERGLSLFGGKRSVTLAVIKQADETMDHLKEAVGQTLEYFRKVYPEVDFAVSRNQTELLDYTISNLQVNLLLGFLFICLVAVLFLGDWRSPLIIGVSMVVSLVICFLFFHLFGMSLNIISLSGLILALGMMTDSCIIVTENITQYREKGLSAGEACVKGTGEVITPMLSSSFTTVAVFLPLIFMSGIAGALFYDQAFAVTAGLSVSYLTGIILLPVLYLLFYRRVKLRVAHPRRHTPERCYDAVTDWVFAHKRPVLFFSALTLPLCLLLFFHIRKERMPETGHNELTVRIEWNGNIHIGENRRRVDGLFAALKERTVEQAAAVGEQDYLLNRDRTLSASEAELYLKTRHTREIAPLQDTVARILHEHYPEAIVSFSPPETVFEKLFTTGEADVCAELYPRDKAREPRADGLRELEQHLAEATGVFPSGPAFQSQLNLYVLHDRLLLYHVDHEELLRVLKTAFKGNQVTVLHSFQQYLPVTIAGEEQTVSEILQQTLVQTRPDEAGHTEYIPLNSLVRMEPAEDLKCITAGRNGEYIPFLFYRVEDGAGLVEKAGRTVEATGEWDTFFSGAFFSSREMLDDLVVILLISLLLMYFILAAQFESFLQPLIVLLEIPVDVAFALLLLWVCGHTLNLMSAIGIIVTCGIVINDSILKLDAINMLRKAGMPLLEAIHEAGRRRLRAIIMTSLTTILAMVPLLFSSDMGSELQKPLAIAMMGAMVVGTLVSLFVIPLVYWYIHKEK